MSIHPFHYKNGRVGYRVVVDIAGRGEPRRQQTGTFATKAEAVKWEASVITDRERRTHVAPDRVIFNELADECLAIKGRTCRANTVIGYRTDLKHPRRAFGNMPVQQITERDVEAMVAAMVEAGLSHRTVGKALTTLRSVLDVAVRRRTIPTNPATWVQASGTPPMARKAFTPSEWESLRTAAGSDAGTRVVDQAVWCLVMAGLRRSEVLGLRWNDIDFSAGSLTIQRSRVPVDGKHTEIGQTKTAKGKRTLYMPDEVMSVLAGCRTDQAQVFGLGQARDGYVAVDAACRPLRPERLSDEWRVLCGLAGVRVLTLHSARHSSVTLMRDRGVDDHIVAAWHGHDEVVMRQTYSHAQPETLKAAGEALFAM